MMYQEQHADTLRAFKDFRSFLYFLWTEHLDLPEPTNVQNDVALYLQYGPKRCIIEAFRGMGKTWITAAYCVWQLLHNPQYRILIVSATATHAENVSRFMLQLVHEVPELQHLAPSEGERASVSQWDCGPAEADVAPSVRIAGITGMITGGRADLIIADDIEVSTNSRTQVMRDKTSEAVKEFDNILKPLPHARVIFLGTPHAEDSVYNILHDRGYDTRIWPIRVPAAEKMIAYGTKLAPWIRHGLAEGSMSHGDALEPTRFGVEDLMEREASQGRSGFAMQWMLDTALADAERYPLKVRDLIVMPVNPQTAPEKCIWLPNRDNMRSDLTNVAMLGDNFHGPAEMQGTHLPYEQIIVAVDPSGRGTDETTFCVMGLLNSQLYVIDLGGWWGGYNDETLDGIAKLIQRYDASLCLIESNFGDGMFAKLLGPFLRRRKSVRIEEVRHNIQKELRIIETLEPVMNQHRLILDEGIIERDYRNVDHMPAEEGKQYQLIHQMTRLTKEKGCLGHDDRLDVLAMAVAFFLDGMQADVDERIHDRQDELLEAELARYDDAQSYNDSWIQGRAWEYRR